MQSRLPIERNCWPLPELVTTTIYPANRFLRLIPLKAIETGEVVYADGNEVPYRCSLHPQCKLGSTLVIPLRGENQRVMGTIKLYEAKTVYSVQSTARWARGLRNCFRRRSSPGNMSGKSDAHPVRDQTASRRVNPHFCLMRLTPLKR